MLPRTTLFQFLIEGALFVFLVALLVGAIRGRAFPTHLSPRWWRTPLLVATISFFGISAFVSALSALDTQRAWFGVASWGNEGMLMYLHYLAFLLLALAFFSKKEILQYLFASIGVGTIVALFAVLQFVGVDPFELTPDAGGRVGSFLENPTYLAAYLAVLLAISGILLRHGGSYEFLPTTVRAYATRFLAGFVALAILVIGLTQTRGALVGVVGGAFVFLALFIMRAPASYQARGVSLKLAGAGIALTMILFVGIFWTTRQADFWGVIPVLSRVANISATDPTVATRLISLQISRDAFMERPLVGWGPDNSYIAHTKYYNPELFWYEETWFERMHNKIADVAVNQGVLGLVTFGALWTVLALAVWRDTRSSDGVTQLVGGGLVAGGLTAYLGQNMFAFDLPTAYIAFFSVLLFYAKQGMGDGAEDSASVRFRFMKITGIAIASPILLYVFLGFTLIPFRQSTLLISSIEGGSQKLEENADAIYAPETHIQRDIHRVAMIELQNAGAWDYPAFRPAMERLIEESARRTEAKEYDPRSAIFLGVFALSGGYTEQAERFGRIGLERAPNRPDAYHGLGRALMHGQKFDEAQDIFRQGVVLNDRVASSHFYYATALALEDATEDSQANKSEALTEFAKAQELGIAMNMSRYDTLGSALFEYREWEQLSKVMTPAVRENPDSSRFHQMALSAALVAQDREVAMTSIAVMIQLNAQSSQIVTRLERVRSFIENARWADARREMGIE
jgi:O-antigen ligase/tetratricopeptide (TPR) repeat protein